MVKKASARVESDAQSVGWVSAAPIGTHIAYLIYTPGIASPDLYLADTTGNAVKLLSSPRPLKEWSADGRWITGFRDDGAVFRYNVQEQRLTSMDIPGFHAWLPDGEHALALCNGQVYRENLLTGQAKQLSDFYIYIGEQDLSRNHWEVWFSQWHAQNLLVAPDGQAYILGNRNFDMFLAGNGGFTWRIGALTEQRGLPHGLPLFTDDPYPRFSPQGTFFAGVSYHHNSAYCSSAGLQVAMPHIRYRYTVYVPLPDIDRDRGLSVSIQGVSWSPDEQQLAFATEAYVCGNVENPPGFTPHIYGWDVNLSDPRNPPQPRLLDDGRYPSWVALPN